MRIKAPLLATLLFGCAPDAGVVDIAVLQRNPATGAYELKPATLTTLEDLQALKGEAATPIGSAEIDFGAGFAGTEGAWLDQVLVDAGSDVHAQFVEQDGVLWPADFHSLNLATAYYNFERTRAYALARGLPPDLLRGVPFYYFPEVHQGAGAPQVDNAAWAPQLRSFLMLPFDELQEVPLAMNQGVVAHEYGHAIFHALVHGGGWFPGYIDRWCPADGNGVRICPEARGVLLLDSIEEGFADAWAVGVTGDPRFTHHSLSALGDSRDPNDFESWRHCYGQQSFEKEIEDSSRFSASEQLRYWGSRKYEIGTVLAGALWRAGQSSDTDYDRVMDAVIRSYGELEVQLTGDPSGAIFGRFDTLGRALIGAAPDDGTRRALCRSLQDRLSLDPAELDDLCNDIPSNEECP